MGCLYQDRDGQCTLSFNIYGEFEQDTEGSIDGECQCIEDPDPNIMCESYESDYTCRECGTDLNIDECKCEEE